MMASQTPSRKRPSAVWMTLDSIGNQGVRQDAARIPNGAANGEVDQSYDGLFQAPSPISRFRYNPIFSIFMRFWI
jgi:hypothetical protein